MTEIANILLKDGTLVVTVDKQTYEKTKRVLVETSCNWGTLFYQDDSSRPKGKWIEKVHQDCFGTKETICPFCNFSMVEWWGVKNYCPSCGAELHEKGKGEE